MKDGDLIEVVESITLWDLGGMDTMEVVNDGSVGIVVRVRWITDAAFSVVVINGHVGLIMASSIMALQ